MVTTCTVFSNPNDPDSIMLESLWSPTQSFFAELQSVQEQWRLYRRFHIVFQLLAAGGLAVHTYFAYECYLGDGWDSWKSFGKLFGIVFGFTFVLAFVYLIKTAILSSAMEAVSSSLPPTVSKSVTPRLIEDDPPQIFFIVRSIIAAGLWLAGPLIVAVGVTDFEPGSRPLCFISNSFAAAMFFRCISFPPRGFVGFTWTKGWGSRQLDRRSIPAINVATGKVEMVTVENIEATGLAISYRWSGKFKDGLPPKTVERMRTMAASVKAEYMFVDHVCCSGRPELVFEVNWLWYHHAAHHVIVHDGKGLLTLMPSSAASTCLWLLVLYGLVALSVVAMVVVMGGGAHVEGRMEMWAWFFVPPSGYMVLQLFLSKRAVASWLSRNSRRAWIALELLARQQFATSTVSAVVTDKGVRIGSVGYESPTPEHAAMTQILSFFATTVNPEHWFAMGYLHATRAEDAQRVRECGEALDDVDVTKMFRATNSLTDQKATVNESITPVTIIEAMMPGMRISLQSSEIRTSWLDQPWKTWHLVRHTAQDGLKQAPTIQAQNFSWFRKGLRMGDLYDVNTLIY